MRRLFRHLWIVLPVILTLTACLGSVDPNATPPDRPRTFSLDLDEQPVSGMSIRFEISARDEAEVGLGQRIFEFLAVDEYEAFEVVGRYSIESTTKTHGDGLCFQDGLTVVREPTGESKMLIEPGGCSLWSILITGVNGDFNEITIEPR